MEDLRRVYAQADDFARFPERYPTKTFHDGRLIVGQGFGVTIRVILPVGTDTGVTVPFEVWVAIHPDDLAEVAPYAETADWTGQTCRGLLLNAVEPWPEVYEAPVTFECRPGHLLPVVVGTEHEVLRRVLTGENRLRVPGTGPGVPPATGPACYCCGEVLDQDNLAWDFRLPDELADLSTEERAARMLFASRVFIVAEGYGTAARVILPIALDTGHTVTLGVWMAPDDPDTMVGIVREGGAPWIGYTFTGTLLNAVQPWPETRHTEITAKGLADHELARVVDAEHPTLKRVLTEKWPHRVAVESRQA